LALYDAASFVVVRERGVQRAFTLDRHFDAAGFAVVPPR
jgi:predicted nucleic acid-binding protein